VGVGAAVLVPGVHVTPTTGALYSKCVTLLMPMLLASHLPSTTSVATAFPHVPPW
jgi:hypothetical protein